MTDLSHDKDISHSQMGKDGQEDVVVQRKTSCLGIHFYTDNENIPEYERGEAELFLTGRRLFNVSYHPQSIGGSVEVPQQTSVSRNQSAFSRLTDVALTRARFVEINIPSK